MDTTMRCPAAKWRAARDSHSYKHRPMHDPACCLHGPTLTEDILSFLHSESGSRLVTVPVQSIVHRPMAADHIGSKDAYRVSNDRSQE